MTKASAFLINKGRGGFTGERGLYAVLRRGYIARATLDVTVAEPPGPNSLLLQLDSVLITPYLGFYSEQSLIKVLRQVEEEV